jgi:hypothetical protein
MISIISQCHNDKCPKCSFMCEKKIMKVKWSGMRKEERMVDTKGKRTDEYDQNT